MPTKPKTFVMLASSGWAEMVKCSSAKKALLAIRRLLGELVKDYEVATCAWYLLSALRGPDIDGAKGDTLKNETTCWVRGAMRPARGTFPIYGMNDRRDFASSVEAIMAIRERVFELRESPDGSMPEHFRQHVEAACDVLLGSGLLKASVKKRKDRKYDRDSAVKKLQ